MKHEGVTRTGTGCQPPGMRREGLLLARRVMLRVCWWRSPPGKCGSSKEWRPFPGFTAEVVGIGSVLIQKKPPLPLSSIPVVSRNGHLCAFVLRSCPKAASDPAFRLPALKPAGLLFPPRASLRQNPSCAAHFADRVAEGVLRSSSPTSCFSTKRPNPRKAWQAVPGKETRRQQTSAKPKKAARSIASRSS